ncbi:MAG: ChbG/HpnK family deacetylase [Acidobacteria bacterium]|nr:ChbG/HpnK family deacetylase [Acidobacteriota bacterium]
MIERRRVLIPHVDDLGCASGANKAMVQLAASGAVTSGSVMVPAMWFADVASIASAEDLDLGVHLTLTSESAAARWRPVSTTDRATGLFDPTGFMWPTVRELRDSADPVAVAAEMRRQVDLAMSNGIDVTHLDHHMGAALAPEFVEHTVDLAIDFNLPMLFASDIASMLAAVKLGEVDIAVLEAARRRATKHGVAVGDTFLMPLIHRGRSDHELVLKKCLADVGPGVTYLSLHCSAPGDIEAVHPKDAAWRIGEYRVFRDATFQEWLANQGIDIVGMRGFRDRLRGTTPSG